MASYAAYSVEFGVNGTGMARGQSMQIKFGKAE
jgi:hypothetical protein